MVNGTFNIQFNIQGNTLYDCVGFEVVTSVFMKFSNIFWGITLCSTLKVNRYFGGTHINFIFTFACCLFRAGFLFGLSFSTQDGGDIFPPDVG
jgi:hypothetical protein